MEKQKTIREVLEEFLRKHYLLKLTSCVNIPYEDEALSDIKQVLLEMLPEKLKNPGEKYVFEIPTHESGWNACREETKKRIEEL